MDKILPLLNGTGYDAVHSETHNVDEVWLGADSTHHTLVATFVDEGDERKDIGSKQHRLARHATPYLETHLG